jgi:hypothetical protein
MPPRETPTDDEAWVAGDETTLRLMCVFAELVAAGKLRVETSPEHGGPVYVPVNEADDPIALLKEHGKELGLILKEDA